MGGRILLDAHESCGFEAAGPALFHIQVHLPVAHPQHGMILQSLGKRPDIRTTQVEYPGFKPVKQVQAAPQLPGGKGGVRIQRGQHVVLLLAQGGKIVHPHRIQHILQAAHFEGRRKTAVGIAQLQGLGVSAPHTHPFRQGIEPMAGIGGQGAPGVLGLHAILHSPPFVHGTPLQVPVAKMKGQLRTGKPVGAIPEALPAPTAQQSHGKEVVGGPESSPAAAQGIVPAQGAVFPAAQRHTGAKLIVKIACGDAPAGIGPAQIFSRKTEPLEVAVIAQQRTGVIFGLDAGAEAAPDIVQLHVIVGADASSHVPDGIGLHAAAQSAPPQILRPHPKGHERKEKGYEAS